MNDLMQQFRVLKPGRDVYGWIGRSRQGLCSGLDAQDVEALWPEYLEVMATGRIGPRAPFPRLVLPIESMNESLLRALRSVPQVVRNRTTLVVQWSAITPALHAARRELLVTLGFGLGVQVRCGTEAPSSLGSAVLLGAHLLLVDPGALSDDQFDEVRGALGRWMQVMPLDHEVSADHKTQPAPKARVTNPPVSAWGALA
jgi:hypothetical protein